MDKSPPAPLHPIPSQSFQAATIGGGWNGLAAVLLAPAYPELPVNTTNIETPFHSDDTVGLFAAAFGYSDASAGIFRRLGSSLGLSSLSDPERLDPTNCRVFRLLRRKLQESPQPVGIPEIHHHLAYEIGLTESLSTLFILLFGYWGTPELQVRLNGHHPLTLADGRILSTGRLTSDSVPSSAWSDRMVESLAINRPATPPHWQDAVNHLTALCLEIHDSLVGEDWGVLEPRLLSAAAAMQCRVQNSLDLLRTFRDGPEATPKGPPSCQVETQTEALNGSLSRLSHISDDGLEVIYLSIRSTYRNFSFFERALEDLARTSELSDQGEEIRMAQIFLAGARVPPSSFAVSTVDREALLNASSPVSLVRSRGRGWPAAATDLESFKSHYNAVYREHHRWFYQALPAYQRDLEAARRNVRAVELFGTLPELNSPSSAGFVKELWRLPSGPARCDISPAELAATTSPRCPECDLSLEDMLPVDELARLTPTIEAALADKTRALSGQLVGRVLRGGTDSRLEEFLKMVQASELTALSNTLDPELLAFIRSVLD